MFLYTTKFVLVFPAFLPYFSLFIFVLLLCCLFFPLSIILRLPFKLIVSSQSSYLKTNTTLWQYSWNFAHLYENLLFFQTLCFLVLAEVPLLWQFHGFLLSTDREIELKYLAKLVGAVNCWSIEWLSFGFCETQAVADHQVCRLVLCRSKSLLTTVKHNITAVQHNIFK